MTGIKVKRTLQLSCEDPPDSVEQAAIARIEDERLIFIEQLQIALTNIHKKVSSLVSKNRARQLRAHNKKTNIDQPNFTVGDFVLVRRAQDKGHKLSFQ